MASYTAASNQMTADNGTALAYDAAGDVIADPLNTYLYDAEGRLCAARTVGPSLTGYFYDAMGTRVAKGSLASFSCNFATNGFTPSTSYVLGLKGEQITELTVSGAAGSYVSTWKHANVFDGLGLQATYSLTGAAAAPTSTYFALNDWLGTKRAEVGSIVGSNGAPQPCVATFASLPYGDGLTPSGNCPDATEHHFTGKERDSESGNDYFGARYYSSAMGRFMSPDWSAKVEPVPYAKLDDPQSLNLYAYVRNNPLTRVDADGHGEPGCWCQPWVEDFENIVNHPPQLPTKQDIQFGALVVTTFGYMAIHNLNPFNAFHKDAPAPTPAATPAAPAAPAPTTGATPLPTGLVGTQDAKSGPQGDRHNSGPLDPAHGGSGDARKDFGTLTGGKSGPAGSNYPPGTQAGDNKIALRPATGSSGPRIDVPANGSKPHETLHYPPPPPPQPKP